MNKIEFFPIIFTSVYLYLAYLSSKNVTISLLLFFVFASAFLHHLLPENQIVRLADWGSAIILIALVLSKFERIDKNIILIIVCASFFWLTSFTVFHFYKTYNLYAITHSIWHVLSAYIIYLVLI